MIIDRCRDEKEFYSFFNNHPMNDGLYTYEFILNNPNLFCFYNEKTGVLEAYISITQDKKERLFLSGAAIRKNMPENINAIIKICEAYPKNMYAETDKKPAQVVLRKAGFKKIGNNIFARYKNGKK
jgi:hypothetical protein